MWLKGPSYQTNDMFLCGSVMLIKAGTHKRHRP